MPIREPVQHAACHAAAIMQKFSILTWSPVLDVQQEGFHPSPHPSSP